MCFTYRQKWLTLSDDCLGVLDCECRRAFQTKCSRVTKYHRLPLSWFCNSSKGGHLFMSPHLITLLVSLEEPYDREAKLDSGLYTVASKPDC